MSRRNSRTWILVADAKRATIYTREGAGEPLIAVEGGGFRNPDVSHHPRDLGSDRPARSVESVGGARHAIETRQDPRRIAAAHFAKEVAGFLERQVEGGGYDRLVIVAPPRMLSNFRTALGPHARAKLAAELNQDLTKIPIRDLSAHVEPLLRP